MTCPSGFTTGLWWGSCRLICPSDFKYERGSGGGTCIYTKDNRHRVRVNDLSVRGSTRESDRERERFERELQKVRDDIRQSEADTQRLQDARDQSSRWTAQAGSIASEAAAWRELSQAGKDLRETTDSLRPMRPPTAPSSDLDMERRAISFELKQGLTFLQVVLFLVVLALLGYLFLSTTLAHGIAFLLLCVAIATGFFLRN